MTEKRVVITGTGAVSPVGNDAASSWEAVCAGKNGIGKITKFDISDQKVSMGAEVKDFEYPDKREGKRLDLFSQYGIVATGEALAQAGLVIGENIAAQRINTYVGSGIGGIMTLEAEIKKASQEGKGPKYVSAMLVPMIIGNMAAGNIAIAYGLKGSALDLVTACSCGTHAIGEAFRTIRHGYADAVVAGATEAPFAAVCFAGFANMKAMNTTDDPARASIPFDAERGGFVMGEGAGILVLEELEHAKARGANILAEVVGYGTTCDAYHITSPAPTGEGAAASMKMAIESAGISPSQISYINAHGTSTPLNDLYETRAIKEVFGAAAYDIPVSSTKSMTGHMLGAAGGIEAVFCVGAIRDGIVPPTIGYKVADEELDLDYVTEGARKVSVEYTLSNNLGFGGHNGTVVFKRYE
ncbi:MAG: beta-ketoacyl-ACP synthase II [Clostridiales Family XIII bacterium]|jgi:3-oxoacyl-[acyl-carrier-protein] synthase II|nr:beta-ketoacyl-ACP synthase II [Clostridiales Family XIII bacterium]